MAEITAELAETNGEFEFPNWAKPSPRGELSNKTCELSSAEFAPGKSSRDLAQIAAEPAKTAGEFEFPKLAKPNPPGEASSATFASGNSPRELAQITVEVAKNDWRG